MPPNHDSISSPASEMDGALEVEAAELSSDEELQHTRHQSKNNAQNPEDDFVLEEEEDDDSDDDSSYSNSHPPTPDGNDSSRDAYRSRNLPKSYSDQRDSTHQKGPSPINPSESPSAKDASNSSQSSASQSSGSRSDESSDLDQTPFSANDNEDDANQQVPSNSEHLASAHLQHEGDDRSEENRPQNGQIHESDSEPDIRKGTRRRARKLVIPEDMKDDDQFFRRSNRARSAPERLAHLSDESASESAEGSDSDFDANGK